MTMVKVKVAALAGGGFLLLTTFSGAVSAAEQRLSCQGQMIEPAGKTRAPINLNLTLGGPKGKTTIEMSGGEKVNANVTSNNQIQLKFRTKQYIGEFFYYTDDLFLIHKSGHLARLTCSPG
jgi:hypothetical protein